ncbi:MAG: hypothetical protein ABI832_20905 [bacterium]
MSRFKLPPRVAPSPAAGEPGMQNAVARLRSSRQIQDRFLAEQRGQGGEIAPEVEASQGRRVASVSGDVRAEASPSYETESLVERAGKSRKDTKEKIVVMFRLPKAQVERLSGIPEAAGLSNAYVLKAFAKEGRAALRAVTSADDLAPLVATAKSFRLTKVSEMTVGEAMTVYIQPVALEEMHIALGDPWMILPKATASGAFLAAVVIRLIEARLARKIPS